LSRTTPACEYGRKWLKPAAGVRPGKGCIELARPAPYGWDLPIARRKDIDMGLDDKVHNKADKLAGKAKEAEGNARNDDSMKAAGKVDQAKSDVKDAGEKVKDAFKH
jgi:uncharacterized protein YjbJ (UPF0337 family)